MAYFQNVIKEFVDYIMLQSIVKRYFELEILRWESDYFVTDSYNVLGISVYGILQLWLTEQHRNSSLVVLICLEN